MSLAAEDVLVAFGGMRALDRVRIEFGARDITGLIGPNGSGKSTLVNTLSGEIVPSFGRIRFAGHDITGMRADRIVRLGLARTYQIPRVPPQLTLEEVITVPLIYGRGAAHLMDGLSDAASIAELCGLAGLLKQRCGDLSVTDLRRLEIARALACGPSMILLDEIMAGLSHQDFGEVMGIIRRINASGIGVVIIEHIMRVITALCHRVVVLSSGTLLADGTAEAVLADKAVREAYLGRGVAA